MNTDREYKPLHDMGVRRKEEILGLLRALGDYSTILGWTDFGAPQMKLWTMEHVYGYYEGDGWVRLR